MGNSNKKNLNLINTIFELQESQYIRLEDNTVTSESSSYKSNMYRITSNNVKLYTNITNDLKFKRTEAINKELKIYTTSSNLLSKTPDVVSCMLLMEYYNIAGLPIKNNAVTLCKKFNATFNKYCLTSKKQYFNIDTEDQLNGKLDSKELDRNHVVEEFRLISTNETKINIFSNFLKSINYRFGVNDRKSISKTKQLEPKQNEMSDIKINWQKQRMRVWIDEPIKLRNWGIESYVEGHSGKCFCCHTDIDDTNHEAGHIIPRSHNGSDDLTNLRTICKQCNRGKDGMFEINAYEFMYINSMPGLSTVKYEDPNHLVGLLLHRETMMLNMLKSKGLISAPIPSSKTLIKQRLDVNWSLFDEAIKKIR